MQQVISANRLVDGIVVFFGVGQGWVEGLQQALVFTEQGAVEAALAAAALSVKSNLVVDVAAFDVTGPSGHIRATHIRDAIRAAGPTVRLDHGKQAVGL